MSNLDNAKVPSEYYRPEQQLCPLCASTLKRHHILWHKSVTFSTGPKQVVSWAYRCPWRDCPGANVDYRSAKAEGLHLKYRGFSRELIVRIGYRRFWQHQPQADIAPIVRELGFNIVWTDDPEYTGQRWEDTQMQRALRVPGIRYVIPKIDRVAWGWTHKGRSELRAG